MSIKQTEGPQEDLLLLLPAAGKLLSGDTYKLGEIVPYAEFKKSFGRLLKRVTLPDTKMSMNQSGISTVRRKVGLDLDTLAVNLTGEGLLLGEFTVNMEDTDGRGQTSQGRAKFKWALQVGPARLRRGDGGTPAGTQAVLQELQQRRGHNFR